MDKDSSEVEDDGSDWHLVVVSFGNLLDKASGGYTEI
jgi:hypothetical protein